MEQRVLCLLSISSLLACASDNALTPPRLFLSPFFKPLPSVALSTGWQSWNLSTTTGLRFRTLLAFGFSCAPTGMLLRCVVTRTVASDTRSFVLGLLSHSGGSRYKSHSTTCFVSFSLSRDPCVAVFLSPCCLSLFPSGHALSYHTPLSTSHEVFSFPTRFPLTLLHLSPQITVFSPAPSPSSLPP